MTTPHLLAALPPINTGAEKKRQVACFSLVFWVILAANPLGFHRVLQAPNEIC